MKAILSAITAAALLATASTMPAQMQSPDPTTVATDTVNDLVTHRFSAVEKRFDSRMQSGLPVDKLAVVWDALIAKSGPFERVLGKHVEEQGDFHVVAVTCKFKYENYDLQFAIDGRGQIAGMHVLPPSSPETPSSQGRPGWAAPSYAKPSSFHEIEVPVQTGKWTLPGTLTLPNGNGPFPAVVLVQGSGPHDQDETIGGNKPFKDIAWGLASQGVAVLRYVKRTKQYGAEAAPPGGNLTVNEETTDDARSAVRVLALRSDISAQQIYVLGHSLGGMMAPRIAANDKQVAGIVIAAGAARPLELVIVDQLKYLASLGGPNNAELKQQVNAAEKAKAEIESPALKPDTSVSLLGASIPGSYFLDLRNYHPAEFAAQLDIPILVLQGGRDYQVTVQDYDLWKAALGKDPRATFKFYPGLTHLFMSGTGSGHGSPADYSIAGHVSGEVVNDLVQWVKKNSARK